MRARERIRQKQEKRSCGDEFADDSLIGGVRLFGDQFGQRPFQIPIQMRAYRYAIFRCAFSAAGSSPTARRQQTTQQKQTSGNRRIPHRPAPFTAHVEVGCEVRSGGKHAGCRPVHVDAGRTAAVGRRDVQAVGIAGHENIVGTRSAVTSAQPRGASGRGGRRRPAHRPYLARASPPARASSARRRNLSTTLRHRRLEITEQAVLSQPRPAG